MESASSSQSSSQPSAPTSGSSAESAEEFMSLDYFYKGIRKLDSDDTQTFSRIVEFLKKDVIRLRELQQFIQTKRCIPEQARGLIWRIQLNYLPEARKNWTTIIDNNVKHYDQLIDEYIVSRNRTRTSATSASQQQSTQSQISQQTPLQSTSSSSSSSSSNLHKKMAIIDNNGDHPLNRKHTSSWNGHFKDLEIWETIEKDTRRTRAEFFSQKNPEPRLYSGSVAKLFRKSKSESISNHQAIQATSSSSSSSSKLTQTTTSAAQNSVPPEQVEFKYDVLTRILFLFYKITPEESNVRYVQGMNEIAGIIYQCFSQENCAYLKRSAESDAFYCFYIVMTRVKSMFNMIHKDDMSSLSKISFANTYKVAIDSFTELFKRADAQLFQHFAGLNIDPKLYCLGWMMGFFCQTFDVQKALQLWDCLFIANDIIEFIPYICVAILYVNRDELILKSTPSEIILKLQTVASTNIEKLTKMSFALYGEFPPKKNQLRI